MTRPIECSGMNFDLQDEGEILELRSIDDPEVALREVTERLGAWIARDRRNVRAKSQADFVQEGAAMLASEIFAMWNEKPDVTITPGMVADVFERVKQRFPVEAKA